MVLAAYAPLLRTREPRLLLCCLALAGLGTGFPLAMALVTTAAGGSLAAAGLVLSLYAVTVGASSPIRGRSVDRYGQTQTLTTLAVANLAAFASFAALATTHSGTLTLCMVAVGAGATTPPVEASVRSAWGQLTTDAAQLHAAYSLQATFNELAYMLGPVAVTTTVAFSSAAAALAAIASARALGTLLLVGTSASRRVRGVPARRRHRRPHASPGLRTLMIGNTALGFVFGVLDVGAVALAKSSGTPQAAGIAFAALAAGSMLGGLLHGAIRWQRPLSQRLIGFYGLLTTALVPVPLASSPTSLSGLFGVAGTAVAPLLATQYAMIDEVSDAAARTEAMAWLGSTYALGVAAGSAVAGQAARAYGAHLALAIAPAASIPLVAVTLLRRRTLNTAGVPGAPGAFPEARR